MAFTSPLTAVSGATFTAAQFNTNVRDNLNAIWVGTTAGDMDYYSSSTAKSRVAIGANGSYLSSNGSAPGWTLLYRYMGFLLNTSVALGAGDDAVRFRIPAAMNGWVIKSVAASRKSGTGTPTIQIRNVTDGVDVLSTRLTIDSGETDSSTAATAAVINTSNDDVATGDQFAIDIDSAGTNTLFLWVEIGFTAA